MEISPAGQPDAPGQLGRRFNDLAMWGNSLPCVGWPGGAGWIGGGRVVLFDPC